MVSKTFRQEEEPRRFRVIIAGTRYFNDYAGLCAVCDRLLADKVKQGFQIVIVSGGCVGADLMGEAYAKERGHNIERYPAQWGKYGKKAGLLRNAEMANNADALIAFWNGESRGTRHMIETAREKGLAVRIHRYK